MLSIQEATMTTSPSIEEFITYIKSELMPYYHSDVLEAKALLALHSFQSLGLHPLDMSYIEEYRTHKETMQPQLYIGWVMTKSWEDSNANPASARIID